MFEPDIQRIPINDLENIDPLLVAWRIWVGGVKPLFNLRQEVLISGVVYYVRERRSSTLGEAS
jgi:hypothetical protein